MSVRSIDPMSDKKVHSIFVCDPLDSYSVKPVAKKIVWMVSKAEREHLREDAPCDEIACFYQKERVSSDHLEL